MVHQKTDTVFIVIKRCISRSGFWEFNTYGVYGLYKSDWKVIGGFNTKLFTKWGGEDWDVLDK